MPVAFSFATKALPLAPPRLVAWKALSVGKSPPPETGCTALTIGKLVEAVGPYLAQRKLRFKSRSPGTALLIQQMRDFPVGDHDDDPDALEMALRLMIDLWNGRSAKGPTPVVFRS